jgi:hypothetical protein
VQEGRGSGDDEDMDGRMECREEVGGRKGLKGKIGGRKR